MRTWTLVVSICAHAAAIAAIVVAPIFATADLPEPRRAVAFEAITPIVVPSVPAPARQPRTEPSTPVQSIPVTEPPALTVETPPVSADPPLDLAVPGGTGIPIIGTGGDVVIPPPPPAAPVAPVRPGGNIQPPKRVVYVEPVYPPLALASKTQGIVILEALIDEKGSVREVRVLRGHHLLNDAAVQAVTRWQFTPTMLNGTAVPVVMTVTVGFQLTK